MGAIPSTADFRLIRGLREREGRRQCGLFVVEGEKMVAEALESSFKVEKVFRSEQTGEQAMSRMTLLSSPSTALALVRIPAFSNQVPVLEKGGLYLALDSLRDPGNLGTVLRLADWFGIDAVLLSQGSVDVFNPKVVQSTMGAIFRVKFHYCDLVSVLSTCSARVFGTFLDGVDIYRADLGAPDNAPRVIVVGNEANGISSGVEKCCAERLTIPSFAKGKGSESLNAAVAAAITVSEFRRR